MAVRPVEFQGMIQNTFEPTANKSNEMQRPMAQQDQINTANQQAASLSTTQVGESEQSSENNFDPSRGGDGSGYTGNRDRKKNEEEKKKKVAVPEGSIRVKSKIPSFEAKV